MHFVFRNSCRERLSALNGPFSVRTPVAAAFCSKWADCGHCGYKIVCLAASRFYVILTSHKTFTVHVLNSMSYTYSLTRCFQTGKTTPFSGTRASMLTSLANRDPRPRMYTSRPSTKLNQLLYRRFSCSSMIVIIHIGISGLLLIRTVEHQRQRILREKSLFSLDILPII